MPCVAAQVIVLDKQLRLQASFAAFQAQVLHIRLLQVRPEACELARGVEGTSL